MAPLVDRLLVGRMGAPGRIPPPSLVGVDADQPFEVGRLEPVGDRHSFDSMLHMAGLLGKAVMLLDAVGDVVCMNAEAEALYPTALGRRRDHLFALDRAAEFHFRALVASATSPCPGLTPALVMRLPRRDQTPLVARAYPLTRVVQSGFGLAAAVLILIDPARHNSINPETLQVAFGLTRAEARLAGIIANGTNLFEAANRLRISRSTTRSQLRLIFAKTGTRRQGELVALLARLAG